MAEQLVQKTLIAVTGDAFKSSRLDQMLRNFAASYKLFWFKGVFEEAIEGSLDVTFEKLAARMVAAAWYPVTYFRLNLGASDMLAEAVLCAQERCALSPEASSTAVINTVMESPDPELRSKIRGLYAYVPYRLIRPFYTDRLDEIRGQFGRRFDTVVNDYVREFNRDDEAGAPYRFNDDGDGIRIDAEWARYFYENRHVIRGWFDSKLVTYLQARNPSVPAIPLKIYAPTERNLSAARKYWDEALHDHVFKDIYSGVAFDEASYSMYGPMGVDHFIPWSFVLHDEPWNLAPTFRDFNSSKGNKLPELDEYLKPFCQQQFDALLTLRSTGRHKKMFESYIQIDEQVMRYERTDAAFGAFTESVTKVIVPLHQIAANQGFPTWRPTVDYGVVRI